MRFAIIGAGVIGSVHARLINSVADRAELVAVVDTDLDRARALASAHGAVPYADTASAYAGSEFDAVSVCLPSALHADAAIEALQADKHVLVEKPIDISLEAADRLIAAERATGRIVSVISQRRFQSAPAFVRRAVATGRLGTITSGVTESAFFQPQAYYDSGDWRGTMAMDGGGALMNQGIHALDLLVWLMGEPVEVSARTGRLAHERIEVEDVAAATIVFANGAIGTIVASTAAYPGLPVRVAVHGDGGSAVIEGDDLTYFHSRAAAGPDDSPTQNQTVVLTSAATDLSPIDSAHRAQYADFIAAAEEQRSPLVTTLDARRSLAAVLGVYASARTGQPVSLREGTAR